VVEAARSVVEAGGYREMTIRSLAGRLGGSPMSLYRHVRDKDDLLDEVVDHLLAGAWRPQADPADWSAWTAEAADNLRRLLTTQPAALHVYLRHPVMSPAAIERMTTMLEVLRAAGFSEAAGRRAYAALQTYTVGFAALEASRAGWKPPSHQAGSLAEELAAYTTPRQFAEGLGYLLEALDRRRTPEG
jgi:AcrR family transcriptional regulator